MWILIVLPYRPPVRHAHQTGSGHPVLQEDPEFQIDKSDTQTKTLRICLATQRGLHSYPMDQHSRS